MKKVILSTLLAILLGSCTGNNDEQLKKIIETDVKSSIPAHWNYTTIKFSPVDSAMSSIIDTPQHKELMAKIEPIDSTLIADSIVHAEGGPKYDNTYLIERKKELYVKLNDLENKYKPRYLGKRLLYSYKCQTDFGDSIYYCVYVFNSSNEIILKEVLGARLYTEDKQEK